VNLRTTVPYEGQYAVEATALEDGASFSGANQLEHFDTLLGKIARCAR